MKKPITWLDTAELAVACSGLAFAATALCADVIGREVFGNGIYGIQKFAVYCCAVSGALGISIVVHRGGHLRISAVDGLIPNHLRLPLGRVADMVSAALCLFLAWYAAKFVHETFTFHEMDTVLNVPIWRIQIALPIAFLLAAIKYAVHAILPDIKPEEGSF